MSRLSAGTIRTVLHRLEMIERNANFGARLYPAMTAVCEGTKGYASEIRNILLRASLVDVEVEPAREKEEV